MTSRLSFEYFSILWENGTAVGVSFVAGNFQDPTTRSKEEGGKEASRDYHETSVSVLLCTIESLCVLYRK
jgi:hypothetical protein